MMSVKDPPETIIVEEDDVPLANVQDRRGRRPIGDRAMTPAERKQRQRAAKKEMIRGLTRGTCKCIITRKGD